MNRLFPLLLALALAAPATLAQAPAVAPAAPANAPPRIEIRNFHFEPAQLVVAAGTRVTWINHDDEPHVVVGADARFGPPSPALDTDGVFSAVFTTPGTYAYFCSIHPQMTGTIVVQ